MDNYINILNKVFLAVSFILVAILFIRNKKVKDKDYLKNKKDKFYLLLIIWVFVLGLVVRLWQFGIVPGGFNQDGAMAAVDGKALAEYGTDRFGTWMPAHLYAWGYSQMSSLLSYLIAIFIKLFDFTPVVVRLPQLLASIMGGIFFYLFMKDTFGKKVGLLAAFFVAINPWHFMQSRWTLEANLLPHFFMGGLYFLNKGLSDKKYFVYLSMIFFALCMYCYGISIYTIPVFLLAVSIYYYIKKKLSLKDILIAAFIYLLISWPFILTMMVNYFKWDTIKLPFVTIQYFPDSVRARDILFFSDDFFKQLVINYNYLVNIVIWQSKDLPWNDILGFGTMYYFTLPFVIVGIWELIKTKIDGNRALLFFALLIGIWVGLVTNYVNVNRLNIIYYGIMMFAVFGIYNVIRRLKYAKWIVLSMYMIIFVLMINTYFTTYKETIAHYFYQGFGEALGKAEASGTPVIYVTADTQGKGHRDVSEILTLFYDKMDVKYFQGLTNIDNGIEYLPYKERFIYVSMNANFINNTKDKDAAYVITKRDKRYFKDYDYKIFEYGEYAAVLKNTK